MIVITGHRFAWWIGSPRTYMDTMVPGNIRLALNILLPPETIVLSVRIFQRARLNDTVYAGKSYRRRTTTVDYYCRVTPDVDRMRYAIIDNFAEIELPTTKLAVALVHPVNVQPKFFSTWHLPGTTRAWVYVNELIAQNQLLPQADQVNKDELGTTPLQAILLRRIVSKCMLVCSDEYAFLTAFAVGPGVN